MSLARTMLEGTILDTQILWGISLARLLIGVILVLLGLFSRRFVRWMVRRALGRERLTGGAVWVHDVLELLPKPLSWLIHAILWYGVGQVLLLPREPVDVRAWVMLVLTVAVALAITYVLLRTLDVLSRMAMRKAETTNTRLDDQLIPLARKTLKIILGVVVGVSIVDKLGFSANSLIASLSIGGLALALAAKDTIANIFGSVIVFTDQPFQVGDVVRVAGTEGVVEEVGIRTTRIRAFDKSISTVPNQTFTSETITNLTTRPSRRIRFEVGLTYSTSPHQMQAFLDALRDWLKAHEALDQDSVMVHFTYFADSSLTVLVQAFTKSPEFASYMVAQEEVLLGVMRLVEENGLDIAFPTRTLLLEGNGTNAEKPTPAL